MDSNDCCQAADSDKSVGDDNLPVISYPAPLPKFSKPIADVLSCGVRSRVMLVYSDIVRECQQFYMALLPSNTARAKLSMNNIGRTITEQYPVLAMPDRPNAWTHFNEKLSSYIRNARSRIRHKLSNPSSMSRPVAVAQLPSMPDGASCSKNCTEEDYICHVDEMKKEFLKKDRDEQHILELLKITHTKRRKFIDSTPSVELRMSEILEKFPVFSMPSMMVEELRLMKDVAKVDRYDG